MRKVLLLLLLCGIHVAGQESTTKRVTLDEFFNSVDISALAVSPDGSAVVIGTERADWKHDRFRSDLWIWRNSALTLLTQSGHDSDPKWSPDGNWIAFISDRAALPVEEDEVPSEPAKPVQTPRGRDGDEDSKPVGHLYVIAAAGGEAIPVTRGLEEVHAFEWSKDSKSLFFATRTPWSKAKRDAYKKEWKDTIRYRESERGDVIARISLADALRNAEQISSPTGSGTQKTGEETAETPGSTLVTHTPWRVREISISPDGGTLAFSTDSISQRVEGAEAYEVYVVPAAGGASKAVTHNQAIEDSLRWIDSRNIAFHVGLGSTDGKYADLQGRVYSIDVESGVVRRWAADFPGALERFEPQSGAILAGGMVGTEAQLYTLRNGAEAVRVAGWHGSYGRLSLASGSPKIAFVYSATNRPTEVYLADSLDKLSEAKPITTFNRNFTERALPQGKPYRWKAPDGTQVEGMLIYPPGKFEAKHLRTLVLIHGGPADADGDRWGADWYDWAGLAAANDWLVFRPNYRGSSGYGDKFLQQIVPNLVSVPGKDILAGVDALVKDGIADPDRLAIGGYSYGGYMTNWLITQTTRFKAAVTGAGAVEHAANWGNDDLTFDDAYYLGGTPWENPKLYQDEAALFIFNKVKTPTHVVGGGDDVRVSVLETYTIERALKTLNVPSSLLIFPGEGHPLAKNPWHGKIKVREELKWLEKYVPTTEPSSVAQNQ